MNNDKKQLLDKILINLKKAKEIRQSTKKDIKLFNSKIALKQHQVDRLKQTHKDLLESEQTKEAALFFLSEIYSFKDLTKRDSNLEKLLPTMGKMFPENTLEVIANAMVLDALTEELENKMAKKLGLKFTQEQYEQAYRNETSYEERVLQIELVKDLGLCLCHLVTIPLISGTLKMMRIPAKIANLEEMHEFLNSGFHTFKNTKNPENFINSLVSREKIILDKIFSKK